MALLWLPFYLFVWSLKFTIVSGTLGTDIALKAPTALWVDSSGSLFVADSGGGVILKIDLASNNVSSVAGSSPLNSQVKNIPATSAHLAFPLGVVGDIGGNLFIADTYNNRICKVDYSTQTFSLVAGDGTKSFSGEGVAATSAQLHYPVGIWLDSSSNLFFADNGNHRIRKIAQTTQIITTLIGTGQSAYNGDNLPATSTTINTPFSVWTDALTGDVYFTATGNNFVRKMDASSGNNVVTIIAGLPVANGVTYNGDNIPATSAALYVPCGIWSDTQGVVYFTELLNHRVRAVGSGRIINTIAGTGTIGYNGDNQLATDALVNTPYFVQGDNLGTVYISDTGNNMVRQVDPSDTIIRIAGLASTTTPSSAPTVTPSSAPSRLPTESPTNAPVYSVSPTRPTVEPTLSPTNQPTPTQAPTAVPSIQPTRSPTIGYGVSTTILFPTFLWADSVDLLYLAASFNGLILKINLNTNIVETFAGLSPTALSQVVNVPATSVKLGVPEGVVADRYNNFYITDTYNQRILKVDNATHMVTLIAGGNTPAGYGGDGGPATSAKLNFPVGPWLDTLNRLYFADNQNNRIRKIDLATNLISTVIGTGLSAYNGVDLPATSTNMNRAFCVWGDDNTGDLVFTATFNKYVRKMNSITTIVSIIAGTPNNTVVTAYNTNVNVATATSINGTGGVWGNTLGEIYFTELYNNKASKVTGQLIQTIGGMDTGGYNGEDQAATLTMLYTPYFLTGDSAGAIYVSDTSNSLARRISTTGAMTKIAGVYSSSPTPTRLPSFMPTISMVPTIEPSGHPSSEPTTEPTLTFTPTTATPSISPTLKPTATPSNVPPSPNPSFQPTHAPTEPAVSSKYSIVIIILPFVAVYIYWYYYTHLRSKTEDGGSDENSKAAVKYGQVVCATSIEDGGGDYNPEDAVVVFPIKIKQLSRNSSSLHNGGSALSTIEETPVSPTHINSNNYSNNNDHVNISSNIGPSMTPANGTRNTSGDIDVVEDFHAENNANDYNNSISNNNVNNNVNSSSGEHYNMGSGVEAYQLRDRSDTCEV